MKKLYKIICFLTVLGSWLSVRADMSHNLSRLAMGLEALAQSLPEPESEEELPSEEEEIVESEAESGVSEGEEEEIAGAEFLFFDQQQSLADNKLARGAWKKLSKPERKAVAESDILFSSFISEANKEDKSVDELVEWAQDELVKDQKKLNLSQQHKKDLLENRLARKVWNSLDDNQREVLAQDLDFFKDFIQKAKTSYWNSDVVDFVKEKIQETEEALEESMEDVENAEHISAPNKLIFRDNNPLKEIWNEKLTEEDHKVLGKDKKKLEELADKVKAGDKQAIDKWIEENLQLTEVKLAITPEKKQELKNKVAVIQAPQDFKFKMNFGGALQQAQDLIKNIDQSKAQKFSNKDLQDAQKILKAIEQNKAGLKTLKDDQKDAVAAMLDVVAMVDPTSAVKAEELNNQIKAKLDPESKRIREWLQDNRSEFRGDDGKIGGKEGIINVNQTEFEQIKKDFEVKTPYKTIKLIQFSNALRDLKKTQTAAGRWTLENPADKKKLKTILANLRTSLQGLTLSDEDKENLKKDLRLLVMLDPALIKEVVQLQREFAIDPTGYDLMLAMYKHAIDYIERIAKNWKKGKLTGGNKDDFDYGWGYYSYIKSLVDEAEARFDKYSGASTEEKQVARKFVQELGKLTDYLDAILHKNRYLIEAMGYDYGLYVRLKADETERLWCGWDLGKKSTQIITAPWDWHITYSKAKDKDGRYKAKAKSAWVKVDTKKPFYRRYYVTLRELAETIDKHVAAKKQKDLDASLTVLEQFILSGMRKFYRYFSIALGLEKCTEHLCEMCFEWDLTGSYDDNMYEFKLADGSRDDEEIKKVSKQTRDDLEKIEQFIGAKLKEKDLADRQAWQDGLQQVKAIQDQRQKWVDGINEQGEIELE